jgi:hypothetical protein
MRIQGGIPVGGNLAGLDSLLPEGYSAAGPEEIAGSPGYRLSEKEINDRLFRYGLQNNPQMMENIRRLREKLQNSAPVRSAGIPGEAGNLAGMYGSTPPGFQNKMVF